MRMLPERRLQLYTAMLDYITHYRKKEGNVYPFGFCYALKQVKAKWEPPMFNHLSTYPELRVFRPATRSYDLKRSGYWFERGTPAGVRRRVAILKKIIKQMSNEQKV